MKILVYTALFFLFFSCTANKTANTNSKRQTPTSNTSQKQFHFFENDVFSIKYPSTWKQIENHCNSLNYTFAPKATISKGFKSSDFERLECFKGMSKLDLEKVKRRFGIDIAKTYVSISSTVLNDTVTLKKIVDNHLHPSNKKNYRFVLSKNELLKETDNYVILSNTTKIKSNNFSTNKLKHIFQKGNNVFIISYLSRDKDYSKYLNDFSTILSSFKTKGTN